MRKTNPSIYASARPEPDTSLGIDGRECVDALKIENAIARQR
jgi:hypothetical protein